MRGIPTKTILLLGASALLAGLSVSYADGTSLPIVNFGSASQCILGVIDEPEPWPSGSHLWTIGPRGGLILTGPAMLCARPTSLPVVHWETSSPAGTSVQIRWAYEGAWSEPVLFAESDVPAQLSSTVRLSVALLREEGTMTTSTRVPRSLSVASPEDGPPAVLVSPATGATIVVWSRRTGASFDLVASTFADGAWSEPRVVAGSPSNERDPQLVTAPDGSAYLLYWVDGPAPRVLVRQASADLAAWSAPSFVSGDGEIATRPSAAVHDGVLHVVYERHDLGLDRTPTSVVLARPDADAWLSEVVAVSWSRAALRPLARSEAGVLWIDWDDGDGAAGWVRMDPAGRWDRPRYLRGGRDEARVRALALP